MTEQIAPRQFDQADGVADWRNVGEGACTFFATGSFTTSAKLVHAINDLAGIDDHHPDIDIRPDGVTVRLLTITHDCYGLTKRDLELARQISSIARDLDIPADPSAVQTLVVTVDALNIADVLPFWRAILGYEPRADSPDDELNDPHRRRPVFYFNKMDAPRPQRNRMHFDVWVPLDQAEARVKSALAAGGRLVNDKNAPSWWVLADPEGNEACVATWTGIG